MAYRKKVFEIILGSSGLWYWRLKGRNGRILADSGEGHSTKSNVIRAIRSLHLGLVSAEIIDTSKEG